MHRFRRTRHKGQSIVEAMLALGVLTTGFLGIFALLSRSFFLNRMTKDELAATYLAAEGVELVKNFIDHDVYSGGTWGTCGGVCAANGDYVADYTSGTSIQDQAFAAIASCPGPNLRFDPSANRYDYSGPVTTKFQRCLRITHGGGANELTANSIVTWSTGIITSQSINLEDHFYNWHP